MMKFFSFIYFMNCYDLQWPEIAIQLRFCNNFFENHGVTIHQKFSRGLPDIVEVSARIYT